jgi:hypothetical protein
MSYVGGSISQAVAISGAEERLLAVEALAASKVAQAAYDAKIALLDAKDAEHDAAIAVAVAKDAAHELRLDNVEALAASKVAQAAYDAKVALLDAKDVAHEARLDAVEGRATALESNLSGAVQAAIDEKVAQTVFDSLASELRTADSALTAALATKVATVVQNGVDAAQDAIIALKKNAADVDAKDAEHDGKIAALAEFVQAMLATYTITKPDGNAYEWTGVIQGLTFSAPSGGSGAPSGDFPITIVSASNGDLTITSTETFLQNYVFIVPIVNGEPDLTMNMALNGNNNTVSVGTLTFQTGAVSSFNAGKEVALYALPADKFPWDSVALYGYRVSANATITA